MNSNRAGGQSQTFDLGAVRFAEGPPCTLDPGWRRAAAGLVEQHWEVLGRRCAAAVAGRLEVLALLGDMARDSAPLLDLDVGEEEWEEEEDSLESELRLSIGVHPQRNSASAEELVNLQRLKQPPPAKADLEIMNVNLVLPFSM